MVLPPFLVLRVFGQISFTEDYSHQTQKQVSSKPHADEDERSLKSAALHILINSYQGNQSAGGGSLDYRVQRKVHDRRQSLSRGNIADHTQDQNEGGDDGEGKGDYWRSNRIVYDDALASRLGEYWRT